MNLTSTIFGLCFFLCAGVIISHLLVGWTSQFAGGFFFIFGTPGRDRTCTPFGRRV